MTMTASELWNIVKSVPREAWPNAAYRFEGPRWYGDGGVLLSTALAEAAFVGAMVRYRLDKASSVDLIKTDGGYMVTRLGHYAETFPTLIEALAAACKQKQEDDDGN